MPEAAWTTAMSAICTHLRRVAMLEGPANSANDIAAGQHAAAVEAICQRLETKLVTSPSRSDFLDLVFALEQLGARLPDDLLEAALDAFPGR